MTIKCVCAKCGRVNVFPEFIRPETYGWTLIPSEPDDKWYCYKCPIAPEKEQK